MNHDLANRLEETMGYIGAMATIPDIRERGSISAAPIIVENTLRLMMQDGRVSHYCDEWGLASWPKQKGDNPGRATSKTTQRKKKRQTSKPSWPPPDSEQTIPLTASGGNTSPPITCLEDAEQAAQSERNQDMANGIEAALSRLETAVTQPAIVPDLPNAAVKLAMIKRFAQLFEQSIASECYELADWVETVLEMNSNVGALIAGEISGDEAG